MTMQFCTLLICCVLMVQNVQNVIGQQNGRKSQTPGQTNLSKNNYSSNPQPTAPQNLFTIKFPSKLYEAVKERQPPNFVVSPLSLRNALVLLSLGTKGETAEEIQKLLKFKNNTDLMKGQADFVSSLKEISSGNSGVKFVSADKIYAQSGWTLKTEYQNNVTELGGEIETVDFGKGEAAAKNINTWVQNKTDGKIEKLVEPEELRDGISLLVLNGIYFKGSWKNPFDNSSTKKKPFSLNASCSVNVEMMTQTNKFQLADLKDAKAQVLILPYKGDRLSMMIYLPNGQDESSLDHLENWLKNQSSLEIQNLTHIKFGPVSVSLPKFKIRSSFQLRNPLQNLGLRKIFDPLTSDFSGMFNDSGYFYVSQVSQETFIEVNEEGTEAAAATGIKIETTSVSPSPQFTADRPFLFQIVDSQTRTVFFSGRFKNPLDSGSGESTASAGQTSEPTCVNLPQMKSTSTNTNESCARIPTSDIEKILVDFFDLPHSLMIKSTGNLKNHVKTRVARLERCVEGQASKNEELIKLNQNLTQTVKSLESKIQELEQKNQPQRNQTNLTFSTGNQTETRAKTTTLAEPRGNSSSFPTAAVYFYYAGAGSHKRWLWNYNATATEPCFNFARTLYSVGVKGSSCVAFHQAPNCTQEIFRMDTTKASLTSAQDIRISSDVGQSSKSVGVCS